MLDVQDIVVDYGGAWALKATCAFEDQTWTSIVGPSGSGKTTLVQALAGFVPLRSGRILSDGRSLNDLPPSRRGFGYVFQHDNLFEHLTVQQNLLLATHDDPAPKIQRLSRVTAVLDRLELPASYLAKRPGDLSGGERARIAVARALVRGQRWLILDEAFSALDEPLRLSIQSWIESLMLGGESMSIISLTHQVREAQFFSDRILALDSGRIAYQGPVGGPAGEAEHPGTTHNVTAKRTLAALDERWSWLDARAVPGAARGTVALPLAPGEWRMEVPADSESRRWTRVVLQRPRLIPTLGGFWLRDRGTGTLLRCTDQAYPHGAAPSSAFEIFVRSDVVTSG